MIGSYANFLVELVDGLYRQVLRAGNFEDSFLKFIAFEQPSELQSYLALDSEESAASFKLRCLEATPTEQSYIEVWGGGYHIRQVKSSTTPTAPTMWRPCASCAICSIKYAR